MGFWIYIVKISQKKTCNRCKGQGVGTRVCELNFSIKPIYELGVILECVPLNPCPKPLTLEDYHIAWLEMDKKRNSQPKEK